PPPRPRRAPDLPPGRGATVRPGGGPGPPAPRRAGAARAPPGCPPGRPPPRSRRPTPTRPAGARCCAGCRYAGRPASSLLGGVLTACGLPATAHHEHDAGDEHEGHHSRDDEPGRIGPVGLLGHGGVVGLGAVAVLI